jgi:hypothetical protein
MNERTERNDVDWPMWTSGIRLARVGDMHGTEQRVGVSKVALEFWKRSLGRAG